MEHLKFRTRTDSKPEGLPAVYVSCHPADAGSTLDTICGGLLKVRNCAVCCAGDMSSPVPYTELSRMHLFVFPVSTRFLTEPNRAADADLPFALEQRIPVLPVLTEPGLEGSSPLQEKFGRLKCLSCLPAAPEELTFHESLGLYLDSLLFGMSMVRKNRDAAETGTLQADSTDPRSMYLSGMDCLFGITVETDRSRALELVTRAAEAGQLDAMGDLAFMYHAGSGAPVNYALAAEWQDKFARAIEGIHGPGSPGAAVARYSLYLYLLDAGRTEDAKAVLLDVRQDTGECTLSDMDNLANRLMGSGKFRDAVVMEKQVYACTRDLFGEDDRAALKSLCTIGSFGLYTGEYETSRALLERVLEKQTALLGKKDRDTLATQHSLGSAYVYLGDQKKAQDLLTRTASVRREVLGEEDRATLATLDCLAVSYHHSGNYKKARELMAHVLEFRSRVLGDRSRDTLNSKYCLAMFCSMTGDTATARKMLTEVVEVYQEIIGPYHPDTLRAMTGIAECFIDEKDWRKARQLLEEVLPVYRKTLGTGYPETLGVAQELARVRYYCGEKEQALKMLRSILSAQSRLLGEMNPQVLTTMYNLGVLCCDAGLHSEGAALLEKTAAARSAVLGSGHPDTLAAQRELERVRRVLNKPHTRHSSRKRKRR